MVKKEIAKTSTNKTETITAKVKPEVKKEVEKILDSIGLSHSEVINILYHQILITNSVPFPIIAPAPAAPVKAKKKRIYSKSKPKYDLLPSLDDKEFIKALSDRINKDPKKKEQVKRLKQTIEENKPK
jgi:addiction module RelB/DinJ family antitoxin